MKKLRFVGSRVVKTGVAIFVTAFICELLDWPAVFAVITAIVTIEPTVSDSIKKGIIRFPASAIGSAYAVLFISLFGNSPLTYTLAAMFTIMTCFRLKLHAGLLVATLTAVAMIEVIHSNYFLSFLIRLGTTSIGLVVSTLVNMFIFPPDYTKNISNSIHRTAIQTGKTIDRVFCTLLKGTKEKEEPLREMVEQLDQEIHQTETLVRFQKEEAKFHPLVGKEKSQFQLMQNQLRSLRLIEYHLDNLISSKFNSIAWSIEERNIILVSVKELAEALKKPDHYQTKRHAQHLKQITEIFWEDNEEITRGDRKHPTSFPPELIILYELVSIYNQVDRYYAE
ncbi:aromatic acid exporter family protein [Oceanobacillus manasiensis]|uniref:aromatic acid exporter family protein n=1 Tax=Oceanobacillus manasiensis TaxID=586413 RepID=UPI0005AA28DE|nr:aromatic acid exporter family protein [Oceanobacillus manasiensis]